VSKDAAKAKEEGKISDEEYKKALELLNNILSDDEKNTVHETFEKARQDAKKKHDDGGLSDEEYKNAVDILDKAEQEKLGLNDEDWAVFQGLVTASFILADANRAIVSANNAGKKDTIARIEELAKSLPEEVREPLLYLCAGFQIVIENQKGCPLAYETVFPDGSSVFGFGSGDTMTAGGSLDSNNDGVVIAAESTGKKYSGNTFLIGYETADTMDLFNEFVCGRPLDLSSMEYDDGKEITTILAVCTDKGVRFFRKERKAPQKRSLKNGELKKMFGQENADLICGIGYMYAIFSDVHRVYNSKATLYNTYTPLSFGDRAYEAYESIIKAEGLPAGIDEDDFAGFMTYKMLLTSSGYTRDIENRLTDAIDESLEEIGARENNADDRAEREKEGIYSGKKDLNDRYTGHLNSSKNICMIGRNKALICSVTNGTKILDLDHGTVADDIEGSYYRAFQEGSKKTYRLLGFANTSDAYLDVDLPLAKVYTTQYRDADIDRSEIEAFKKMLLQYAKDYLYREYRTRLDKDGQVVLVEKTEKEQKESIEAGKIFDPAVKGYEGALLELEKKYGIDMTPEEIRSYTEMLRDRVAGVAPSITRLYELAGAKKLAGDMAKRNTGYWKNVESRMTMAVDPSDMKDVLVEIRMNDEVLNSLPSDIADKYRTYKNILDPANEHISVSSGDIYGRKTASLNEAESEKARLRSEYREDVISDMVREYGDSLVNSNTAGKALPTDQEIKKEFDDLVLALLNRVNPDNILLDDQNTVDEFADLVNHGKERLEGERFETFRDGIREGMSDINSVWLLEELVIRKKVEQGGAYSGFEVWLKEYDEKVRKASSSMAGLKLPDVKNGKNKVEEDKGLSGDERISYLRTSAAYKSIIGDIKQDPAVKEFLAGRKETWDDYCQYVVKKAGLGISEDEE
ncbi:MAG: hypothetical protein IJS86_02975, partial [Lachnospiraceae bacterium]|nr:hypothetical protein [Lachnospiraceae bacterium]